MAPVIASTVQWVILPLVMCAIFAFAWIIASSARTAELRVSSWAGFWAGLLSFVIYVVSQLSQIREPNLHYVPLPGMQLLPLGWGLTTGFVFLWIVRHAVPTRLVGLITLILAGSSTSSIFTYIFIDSLRVSVLYWTLGTALGILLHIVLFPASIAHIFPLAERKGSGSCLPRHLLSGSLSAVGHSPLASGHRSGSSGSSRGSILSHEHGLEPGTRERALQKRQESGIHADEDPRRCALLPQRSEGYLGCPVGGHCPRYEPSAQCLKAFESRTIIWHRRVVIRKFGMLLSRLPNRRGDRARLEDCHANARRLQLHAKAQAHGGHRRLAARVRTNDWLGNPAGDRAHDHDARNPEPMGHDTPPQ
jgi:hypothetical protein